jgi:hypothetical protein
MVKTVGIQKIKKNPRFAWMSLFTFFITNTYIAFLQKKISPLNRVDLLVMEVGIKLFI